MPDTPPQPRRPRRRRPVLRLTVQWDRTSEVWVVGDNIWAYGCGPDLRAAFLDYLDCVEEGWASLHEEPATLGPGVLDEYRRYTLLLGQQPSHPAHAAAQQLEADLAPP